MRANAKRSWNGEAGVAYRSGHIVNRSLQFPTSYQTVDVAVVRTGVGGSTPMVLLGRKKGSTKWCFPGGFVDPSDASLERAAIREAYEETGVSLTYVKYLGSYRVRDWRYPVQEQDAVLTAFFVAGSSGPAIAGDDLAEVIWSRWDQVKDIIVPHHMDLVDALTAHIRRTSLYPIGDTFEHPTGN